MQPFGSIHVHHCTSLPFRFFGRDAELALLNTALQTPDVSLVAFLGPGGQGKTAIVQHWLEQERVDGFEEEVADDSADGEVGKGAEDAGAKLAEMLVQL